MKEPGVAHFADVRKSAASHSKRKRRFLLNWPDVLLRGSSLHRGGL